jgi:hypothetical protein
VQPSDIIALPVKIGAVARRRRVFHPVGVLAEGILERVAPPADGLPMYSCDVIARISKGIGLPGALPDVAGLAWRMPPPQDLRSCGPWDVLLASTAAGSRVGLAPVRTWSRTAFSSLMPLRFRGGLWWVRARIATTIDEAGLALDTISAHLGSADIAVDIDQAPATGRFTPLARLTLRHLDPTNDDIAFDPVLHSDDEVELVPRWLGDVRRTAYRRSREGRNRSRDSAGR